MYIHAQQEMKNYNPRTKKWRRMYKVVNDLLVPKLNEVAWVRWRASSITNNPFTIVRLLLTATKAMAAQGDGDTPAIDPEKEEPKEAEGEDSEEDITDKGDEDAQSKPADDSEKTEQADITVEVDVNIGGADSVPDTGGDTPDGGKPRPPPVEANPAKSLMGNIPIKFVNETGETDNTVVVFLKNEDPNAIATPFVAWRTIRTQSSASFSYPTESEVGALYEEDGMKMTAGPLPAHPGSTWEFLQETEHATPTLKEGKYSRYYKCPYIYRKRVECMAWGWCFEKVLIHTNAPLCVGLVWCESMHVEAQLCVCY